MPTRPNANEWQLWKNIQQTATSLVHKIKDNYPQPNVSYPNRDTIVIPTLDLPFPSDILTPISSYDLPSTTHRRIMDCISKRVFELQQDYQTRYRKACLSMPLSPTFDHDIEDYRRAFQTLYLRHGLPIVQSLVESVRAAAEKTLQPSETKKSFNHRCTPLFEAYFDLNAYPSSAHRLALAAESGMTKRQIEVWFQNHRSRAKKEGKILQRLGSESPLLRAKELWQQHPSYNNSSPERDTSESEKQTPLLLPGFSTARPLHAFPAKYPSNLDLDPFPSNGGIFKFAPPAWPRRPDHTRRRPGFIDMDQFAALFATRLSIRDGTHRTKTMRRTNMQVTVPNPAPHPAFLSVPRIQSQAVGMPRHNSVVPRFAQVSMPSLAPNHTKRVRKPPPFSIALPSNLLPPSQPLSPVVYPTACHESRSSSFSSISSLSSMELQTPPVSPRLSSGLVVEAWLMDDIFTLESDHTLSTSAAKTANPAATYLYPHQTFCTLACT